MPDPMATAAQTSRALVWPRREPRPQWLERYGPPMLALFMLAASRWGSYLIPGPPYVGDLILGLLLANAAFAAAVRGGARARIDPLLGLTIGLLLVVAGVELLFSPFSQDALRDTAPYAYAVIVFLAFPLRDRDEHWVSRTITAALVFHAAWVTLVLFGPNLPTISLGQGHFVFDVRGDIDGTICGLLSVLALSRALLGRAVFLNLVLAAWGAALVFSFDKRAAPVAFAVQLAVLLLLTGARARIRAAQERGSSGPSGRLLMLRARAAPLVVTAALLLLAPVGAVVAQSSVDRLVATFAPQAASSGTGSAAGAGTANARTAAWGQLADWMLKDPGRTIIGVGPGPDFLQESGAAPLLVGQEPIFETRQPHDFLLNTWARFGLVGVVLMLCVFAAGTRLAILVARWAPTLRESDLLAIMVAISMPVPAMFGVILETPFGAIPFFWALGHLSARWCTIARERNLSVRIGRVVPRAKAPAGV